MPLLTPPTLWDGVFLTWHHHVRCCYIFGTFGVYKIKIHLSSLNHVITIVVVGFKVQINVANNRVIMRFQCILYENVYFGTEWWPTQTILLFSTSCTHPGRPIRSTPTRRSPSILTPSDRTRCSWPDSRLATTHESCSSDLSICSATNSSLRPSRTPTEVKGRQFDQGRHFNFFVGGQILFLFFHATGLLKNWKKHHFICSNLTLFIVPFFLSFFLFFSFFFLFSFSLGGDGPPAPLKWRPWIRSVPFF